jgi:tRNA A-37 threonylcarbamoyl transferase component Bud32
LSNEWLPAHRLPVCFAGERVLLAPGWAKRLEAVGISRHSGWHQLEAGELIASSLTACCYRLRLDDGRRIYFKRERLNPVGRLRYWLRPSRNRVEVFACRQLELLDIPVPMVLGFGERRCCGALLDAFVVTLEVPGALDLRQYLEMHWARLPAADRKRVFRRISGKLIEQLRVVHASRFFHQDLKWRNLLLQITGEGTALYWIDAPRAKFRRWRHHRGVVLDLSALARVAVFVSSRFERMRFLRAYLGSDAAPGAAARLYSDVAEHLARRPPPPLDLQLRDETGMTG